jgi:hypothetical protein
MSSFAAQVALSMLLGFAALVVALLLPPYPATWAVALSLGLMAVITCPSPP